MSERWTIYVWSGCGHRQWGLYEGAEGTCPECDTEGTAVEVEVIPATAWDSREKQLGGLVEEFEQQAAQELRIPVTDSVREATARTSVYRTSAQCLSNLLDETSGASQSPEARSEVGGISHPAPAPTPWKAWRTRLWEEVHRVGGPRKGVLVELGRDLDRLLDETRPGLRVER